ncbi:hypothetical protein PR048_033480 [Dryococelus australis]|uniref:PiggyBac transposable element-derived protein domain-containing protein n=1 Tax=Dryococelus australis TaxID=614101 RepID=A0ABQ9G0E7_9NEOP|nr:hypothetical protein PR048_033480 [Dryococelus australis]
MTTEKLSPHSRKTNLQEFEPHQSLSIDKTMLRFMGRLWFKQYMPSKSSTKWGVKLLSLCNSETGLLSRFDVYVGKRGLQVNFDHSNFSIVTISFLARHCSNSSACGKVRTDRHCMPTECKPVACKTKRGDKPIFWLNKAEGMIVCSWHDTGRATLLSTVVNKTTLLSTRAKQSENGYSIVSKQKMVLEYNRNMNGVDRFEQVSSSYCYYCKNTKVVSCIVAFHI